MEEFNLRTPDGQVSALGLSYSNEADFNYLTSTVRMVSVKLWDAATNPEDFRSPSWPLPSSTYPNHCSSLHPDTSHVVRATFSGGVTTNGITSILPNNTNIFRLSTPTLHHLPYLGLADLGKKIPDDLTSADDYIGDGDNYVDICLDLAHDPELLSQDFSLRLLCDPSLEDSVIYPPKGKPHGCSAQEVTLTTDEDDPNIIKSWRE